MPRNRLAMRKISSRQTHSSPPISFLLLLRAALSHTFNYFWLFFSFQLSSASQPPAPHHTEERALCICLNGEFMFRPAESFNDSVEKREREKEKRGPCMAMAKRNWNGNRVIESENMSRNWRLLKYAHKKQSEERVRFGNTALWTTHSSPFKKNTRNNSCTLVNLCRHKTF